MKKYLAGFFAVAFALSLSAFSIKKESSNKPYDDMVWHKYNAAGTAELSPLVTFTGTASGARTAFSCPTTGSKTCAKAYDSQGNDLGILISKP